MLSPFNHYTSSYAHLEVFNLTSSIHLIIVCFDYINLKLIFKSVGIRLTFPWMFHTWSSHNQVEAFIVFSYETSKVHKKIFNQYELNYIINIDLYLISMIELCDLSVINENGNLSYIQYRYNHSFNAQPFCGFYLIFISKCST